MPIENIGPCSNLALANRAARFLAKRACLPIGFFGVKSVCTVREGENGKKPIFTPYVTFDNDAYAEVHGTPLSERDLAMTTGVLLAFLSLDSRLPSASKQRRTGGRKARPIEPTPEPYFPRGNGGYGHP